MNSYGNSFCLDTAFGLLSLLGLAGFYWLCFYYYIQIFIDIIFDSQKRAELFEEVHIKYRLILWGLLLFLVAVQIAWIAICILLRNYLLPTIALLDIFLICIIPLLVLYGVGIYSALNAYGLTQEYRNIFPNVIEQYLRLLALYTLILVSGGFLGWVMVK